jgi:hypothetical protein
MNLQLHYCGLISPFTLENHYMFFGLRNLGFFVVLLSFHAALLTLYFFPIRYDPFQEGANGSVVSSYGNLPIDGLLRIKYEHALSNPRYSVGVFGNSRIVMIGHNDVGLQEDEFFNFGIGGTSFLQSVTLLEELAKEGKAPDVSIISLDHPEMQFFNYPYWPGPLHRLSIITDTLRLSNGNVPSQESALEFLKSLKNMIKVAWGQIKQIWNFDAAQRYFKFMLLQIWPDYSEYGAKPYASDGSTPIKPLLEYHKNEFTEKTPLSEMSNRYLEESVKSLGRLKKAYGLTVIVYESPIEPKIASRLKAISGPYAKETQNRILSTCVEVELDCRKAPSLVAPKGGPYWHDCCHAPAGQLGRYIGSLIESAKRVTPFAVQ